MADPRDVLAQRMSAALGAAFGPEYEAADPVIRPSSFADYQSNAALPLAKQLGRPPRDIAADIIRHLDLAGVAEPPEVSGPGFINLRLLPGWIAAEATGELATHGWVWRPPIPAREGGGGLLRPQRGQGNPRRPLARDRRRRRPGPGPRAPGPDRDPGCPPGRLGHPVRHADRASAGHRRGLHPQAAGAGKLTAFYQAARASSTTSPGSPTGPGSGWRCCRAATRSPGGCGRYLVTASMEYLHRDIPPARGHADRRGHGRGELLQHHAGRGVRRTARRAGSRSSVTVRCARSRPGSPAGTVSRCH